jgi:hypothetical protein
MSELEQLEQKIRSLPPAELAKFREVHRVRPPSLAQADPDSKACRLDGLVAEALADYKAGNAHEPEPSVPIRGM